jgi:O-antigen/teichoic acid export membrane protein
LDWLNKLIQLIAPGRDLLFVTAGNTTGALVSAIFWLFIASLLSVHDYGLVNYYLSLSLLLSVLSLLGLNTTVITFLAKGNNRLQFQANQLVLISNCLAIIPLVILIKHIPAGLLILGISFYTMSWAEILGKKEYRKYAIVVIVQRSLQVILSLLLYYFIGLDGLILGFASSTLLLSYNFFKSLKQAKPLQFNELAHKSSFIIDNYFQAISNTVILYMDKILIAPLFGFGVLGLYQISFQFLLFLSVIPLSLFHFLLPREAAQLHTKKFVVIGLITAVVSSIVFFIAIPTIIGLFFPHFTEAIQASQIMIFSIIPMTFNSVLISKLFGREKSRPVLLTTAIYIFVLLLLMTQLGHILGLLGLAISVIISSTVQSIALFAMSRGNK